MDPVLKNSVNSLTTSLCRGVFKQIHCSTRVYVNSRWEEGARMRSNIERIAKDRGMSLYRLAKEAGITQTAIYKWRKAGIDRAQLGVMARVAAALGCKVDDLFE